MTKLKDELVKVIDKLLLYELDDISELDKKSVDIIAQSICNYLDKEGYVKKGEIGLRWGRGKDTN